MQSHIQKWGNSLALRLPIKLSQQLKLKQGSIVDILLEDGHLLIRPQKYNLAEMLAAITDENCPQELFNDGAKGHEEW